MPEGPEVRRAADRIARAIEGKAAGEVFFAFDELKHHERRLTGATVSAVETRGKAFLIRFGETGLNVYAHLQLYGRWYVTKAGKTPKTGRQLRFAVHNTDHSAWLFSASDVDVLADDVVEQHPYIAKLGPDALDRSVTRARLMRRLTSKPFRRRSLGALYLDQGFVAGIGNYLRSEILYVAGLLPERLAGDLDADERRRLADATLRLTRRSYRTGGITNDAGTVKRLKAAGLTRRFYRFHVFDREGEPCFGCDAEIQRATIGGRRLYWCPSCQPS